MPFEIVHTELFDEQIRDILQYQKRANSSKSAFALLEKIEGKIQMLEDFPYLGFVPSYSIIRNQAYRVVVVESYLIFYKVRETLNRVEVRSIFSSKQEYRALIY